MARMPDAQVAYANHDAQLARVCVNANEGLVQCAGEGAGWSAAPAEHSFRVGDFERELKQRQRGRRGGRRRHAGRTDVRKPVAQVTPTEPTPVSHFIGMCPGTDHRGDPCKTRLYKGWNSLVGLCSHCRYHRKPKASAPEGLDRDAA
jgi:hypothetical protein